MQNAALSLRVTGIKMPFNINPELDMPRRYAVIPAARRVLISEAVALRFLKSRSSYHVAAAITPSQHFGIEEAFANYIYDLLDKFEDSMAVQLVFERAGSADETLSLVQQYYAKKFKENAGVNLARAHLQDTIQARANILEMQKRHRRERLALSEEQHAKYCQFTSQSSVELGIEKSKARAFAKLMVKDISRFSMSKRSFVHDPSRKYALAEQAVFKKLLKIKRLIPTLDLTDFDWNKSKRRANWGKRYLVAQSSNAAEKQIDARPLPSHPSQPE